MNPPVNPPVRGVRCAFQGDRPPAQLHPPPARGEVGVPRGTPGGGRGLKPGETVTAAPPPLTATAGSAMPLAGADGWS